MGFPQKLWVKGGFGEILQQILPFIQAGLQLGGIQE